MVLYRASALVKNSVYYIYMDSVLTSDIFFFITATAIVILTIIFGCAGVYIVLILKDFKDVSHKVKDMVYKTEGELEDVYAHLTESWLFKFIFGKRRGAKKRASQKSS